MMEKGKKSDIPDITRRELRSALSQMLNDKAVGPDGILVE